MISFHADRKKNKCIFYIALIVCIIGIQFLMMELAHGSYIYGMHLNMIVFNFILYAFAFYILFLLTRRLWLSAFIGSTFFMVFSIVNYYVISFHGTPLTYQEFANFKTALNVIGGYKFLITKPVFCILILGITGILLSLVMRNRLKTICSIRGERLIVHAGITILMLLFFVWAFASDTGYRKKMTIQWNWNEQYNKCGSFPCFIESFIQGFSSIDEPNGYTEQKVLEIQNNIINDKVQTEQAPDIILILNETFYDLSQITSAETDLDCFQGINELEHKITGYAVTPSVGGGTNSSEYELLTSNSLQLLGNITPFTKLNMSNANSIVSYLKNMGYYTLGAHPEVGANYMRNLGYAGMGFDEIYFKEDFCNLRTYYDRSFPTDQSVYENLISWYEMMPDMPRFLYLLTIQNHGEWNSNDSKYDLIHLESNLGAWTDTVNEYLSCVSMSDEAFMSLIDYYQKSERPVVICMVGDHAPSFVDKVTDSHYSDEEQALRQRSVPFVIWSNLFKDSKDIGTISMIYLVPVMLQESGLPLSDYYQYLYNLKKDIPILSSYGVYYDRHGNMYTYEEETEYTEEINDYFIMEYNNVCDKRDRIESLFR